MAWVEFTAEEYEACYGSCFSCFGTRAFNELNKSKVDALHFLSYESDSHCLGIVFGEKDGLWASPFSAPFGGFSKKKNVTMELLRTAICELCDLAVKKQIALKIVIPPLFYDKTFYSKVVVAMRMGGFTVPYSDINYAFDYTDSVAYEKRLHYIGWRNLKKVLKMDYLFQRVTDRANKMVAHQIIQKHYAKKGYPLWMTFEALEETSKLIPIDFFVQTLDGKPVASTIVYRVTDSIAQMIYWGADPEYWEKYPLNFLAKGMFEHYRSQGMQFLDLGPSSSGGDPNNGLCTFKESVGCFADLKHAFYFDGRKS